MRIEYDTKFNLKDVAWHMVNNRATPGVVTDISFSYDENIWLSGSDCENIWQRIKRAFGKTDKQMRITYSLTSLSQDGKFMCSGEMVHVPENELYASKEELLASL